MSRSEPLLILGNLLVIGLAYLLVGRDGNENLIEETFDHWLKIGGSRP